MIQVIICNIKYYKANNIYDLSNQINKLETELYTSNYGWTDGQMNTKVAKVFRNLKLKCLNAPSIPQKPKIEPILFQFQLWFFFLSLYF